MPQCLHAASVELVAYSSAKRNLNGFPMALHQASRIFLIATFVWPVTCFPADAYMGSTISMGKAIDDNQTVNYVDASFYGGLAFWLNFGLERKLVNSESLNAAYAGVGFLNLLQLQLGASNQGPIYRVKTEFAPIALLRHNSPFPYRVDPWSLDHIVVSLTYENTFESRNLRNVTFGIGYAWTFEPHY